MKNFINDVVVVLSPNGDSQQLKSSFANSTEIHIHSIYYGALPTNLFNLTLI